MKALASIIILFLVLFLFGCANQNPPPTNQITPSITVANPRVEQGRMTFDTIALDRPGFLVIHGVTQSGQLGSVIGTSSLIEVGRNQNVRLTVTPQQNTTDYRAVLYYDNGNNVFDPQQDTLVRSNNQVVLRNFQIQPPDQNNGGSDQNRASLQVTGQTLMNNQVRITSAELDRPGYIVIHQTDANARAGKVIGYSSLFSGTRSNVQIDINTMDINATNNQFRAIAMLHYDNGDQVYTQADEQLKVIMNGNPVEQIFTITGLNTDSNGSNGDSDQNNGTDQNNNDNDQNNNGSDQNNGSDNGNSNGGGGY